MIQVKQIVTGLIEENCYIIYKNDVALIVDPGDETSKIKNEIEALGVTPIAVILTHAHYDHIGSLEACRVDYEIPVYISPLEKEWLTDPVLNLSGNKPFEVTAEPADYLFDPGKMLEIGPFLFEVVETPGHSPGGVSFIFYSDRLIVSGDALFRGSIGRTDLPGSEPEKLIPSIREKLFTLPEDFVVYPGHGESTNIGHEIQTNPFFS